MDLASLVPDRRRADAEEIEAAVAIMGRRDVNRRAG
jgi:hypothetical protein